MNTDAQAGWVTGPRHSGFGREAELVDVAPDSTAELARRFRRTQKIMPAHIELVRPGEPSESVFFLFSGWAYRYRLLPDGRRQIIDLLLPGDLAGIDGFLLDRPRDGIMALTDIVYGMLDHAVFEQVITDPAVALQVIKLMGAERRRVDNRLVDVGRLLAEEKIASLMLELYERLWQRGFAKRSTFLLPMTQQQIGDHLGMTIVHVNRVLRRLRENGILRVQRQTVVIQDMAKLQAIVSCQINPPPQPAASGGQPAKFETAAL
jgi:CRP-like cAMP-binding protein